MRQIAVTTLIASSLVATASRTARSPPGRPRNWNIRSPKWIRKSGRTGKRTGAIWPRRQAKPIIAC